MVSYSRTFPKPSKVWIFYKVLNKTNEMVSLGDTTISLYTPAPTTWRGRGDQAGSPDPLKFQVPRSTQIFIGGGGDSRPTFLKYLSGGTQEILNKIFANWNVVVHQR